MVSTAQVFRRLFGHLYKHNQYLFQKVFRLREDCLLLLPLHIRQQAFIAGSDLLCIIGN